MYYKEILWLEELVKAIEKGFYKGKEILSRAYRALAGAYSSVSFEFKLLVSLLSSHCLNDDYITIVFGLKNAWARVCNATQQRFT